MCTPGQARGDCFLRISVDCHRGPTTRQSATPLPLCNLTSTAMNPVGAVLFPVRSPTTHPWTRVRPIIVHQFTDKPISMGWRSRVGGRKPLSDDLIAFPRSDDLPEPLEECRPSYSVGNEQLPLRRAAERCPYPSERQKRFGLVPGVTSCSDLPSFAMPLSIVAHVSFYRRAARLAPSRTGTGKARVPSRRPHILSLRIFRHNGIRSL